MHTWLLSLEYLDKPYNHFPSLHVALSWLAVHASAVSRRSRVGLGVLAVGISVSTVFVKQHYIVDVLFGFALAWVAWRLRRAIGRCVFANSPGGVLNRTGIVGDPNP